MKSITNLKKRISRRVVFMTCVLPLGFSCLATVSARPSPEWLTRGVIYQVWLRAFTPEGTLKAAAERLPQIAALGATIVYLPPVYLQDDDPRREYWSSRQKSCGANNPRNPYRIKDYDAIDPEYGTEEDLKAFIAEAHRLGLRVLMDVVLFHCGPTCVLSQRPGFLKTDPQGKPLIGKWGFPMPDFDNPAVREYFIANLLHWVKDCGADGFRGDVSDLVPLGFWRRRGGGWRRSVPTSRCWARATGRARKTRWRRSTSTIRWRGTPRSVRRWRERNRRPMCGSCGRTS
jgi:1,4-alpha-glucan branching enzyme